jgi:hypothetical protein
MKKAGDELFPRRPFVSPLIPWKLPIPFRTFSFSRQVIKYVLTIQEVYETKNVSAYIINMKSLTFLTLQEAK